MRDSWDNYQEKITKISQWRIAHPKDLTWRSSRFPGSLQCHPTDQDAHLMAYQRIKKLLPNGILNWMPNDHTQRPTEWLPRSKQNSTEAAYRDGLRDFDQECTNAIIKMTFIEKWSIETLLNAESRDGEICKCNAQSGFPRADALMLHSVYDLLCCVCVRYGSMICHLCPMELASILPPLSGHWECFMRITVMMPGAEAHIVVQSQFMINNQLCTSTHTRWPGSFDRQSTDKNKAEPNYMPKE
jgi:hypothetical protein